MAVAGSMSEWLCVVFGAERGRSLRLARGLAKSRAARANGLAIAAELIELTSRRGDRSGRTARGRLGVELGHEHILDFSWLRESAGGLLREDQALIYGHFEGAISAFHELDILAEAVFDLGRQTGGARTVISNDAVLYNDFRHELATSGADYRVRVFRLEPLRLLARSIR